LTISIDKDGVKHLIRKSDFNLEVGELFHHDIWWIKFDNLFFKIKILLAQLFSIMIINIFQNIKNANENR